MRHDGAAVILRLYVFALEVGNRLHPGSVMRSLHILFLTIFLVSGTIRAGSSAGSGQPKASPEDGQPNSVKVGDAKLTGSQLRPYTNLWTMSQQSQVARAKGRAHGVIRSRPLITKAGLQ